MFIMHVFGIILLFAFISGLLWLYKYADKNLFLRVVLLALFIGILGFLIFGMYMRNYPLERGGWRWMMGGGANSPAGAPSAK